MSARISTVAKEVGVSAITLRAWERRYGFPMPERSDGNYRTYSDDEVAKLRRVVSLMEHGLKVSEAIARVKGDANERAIDPAKLVERFFAAAEAMDAAAIDDVLGIAVRDLSPERACDEVLVPILRDIPHHLDIAREHVASRAVRNALSQLAATSRRGGKHGVFLLACPEGEQHEGGLLALAVHLKQRGERAVLLGANTPTEAIAAASKKLNPAAICISLIKKRSARELTDLLEAIVASCRAPVIAGGSMAREHLKAVFAAGAEFAEDADELMKKLVARHKPKSSGAGE